MYTYGCFMLMYACVLSHFSHVRLFVTLWTVAHQAPLSRGLSRQEYWSGLPCPPPGDLPDSGIEPVSLTSPALADEFFTTSATREAPMLMHGKNQTNIVEQLSFNYKKKRQAKDMGRGMGAGARTIGSCSILEGRKEWRIIQEVFLGQDWE